MLGKQGQVGHIAQLHSPAAHWCGKIDKLAPAPAGHFPPTAVLPDLHGPADVAQDRRDRGNARLVLVAGIQCHLDRANLAKLRREFRDQGRSDGWRGARAGTDKDVLAAGSVIQ
jgi:hypothetical protein